MSLYIYSRDRRRGLVRQLARRLGIRCVDVDTPPASRNPALVCWGVSTPPHWARHAGNRGGRVVNWVLNTPEAVSVMAHKIRTFERLNAAHVPCLEWTVDRNVAQGWLQADGSVYVRNILQGHSAEGLVYLENAPGVTVPQAPLYTRNYGTPFKEYRIHVVNGNIIDVTMKRRMNETTINERHQDVPAERQRLQVRTYGNGWVFTREGILMCEEIRAAAILAMRAVGAHMGAVDIVAKWRRDACTDCKVVEINSAPALRSTTTLAAYVTALTPLVREHANA